MLHDWLKNIVRSFSVYINKETRGKLLCHALNFIWVYLRFSRLQDKSCLYFVFSKELKPEGKQIPKKSDMT